MPLIISIEIFQGRSLVLFLHIKQLESSEKELVSSYKISSEWPVTSQT